MGALTAAWIWAASSGVQGVCANEALISRAAFVPVAAPQCAHFLATQMLMPHKSWNRT